MTKSTLCLVMMVYNNEETIVDCLDSVIPYIDHWIIVDNQGGSTDETANLVKTIMSGTGIPGQLLEYDAPFHSGNKRTFAVQAAFEKAEYLLIMDADNTLEVVDIDPRVTLIKTSNDFPSPFCDLDEDAYLITKKMGNIAYPVLSLLNGYKEWKYTGVIHEYPELEEGGAYTEELLLNVIIHEPEKQMGEGPGQRSKRHYWNHALMLERELFENKDMPALLQQRYLFYLGQSYRDCGMVERAIDAYITRANAGGWPEEIYYSLLMIARLRPLSGKDNTMDILRAWNYRPQRLEGAYMLMQWAMKAGSPLLAQTISRTSFAYKCDDKLFVETETADLMVKLLEGIK